MLILGLIQDMITQMGMLLIKQLISLEFIQLMEQFLSQNLNREVRIKSK